MKHTLSLALLLLLSALSWAQYSGTMTIGNYTQQEVEATLAVQGTKATLTLHSVRFSRMMPVRVDVVLSPLTLKADSLSAEGVVPRSKGKPYEKHRVAGLHGRYLPSQLQFTASMGGKPFSYKGTPKRH